MVGCLGNLRGVLKEWCVSKYCHLSTGTLSPFFLKLKKKDFLWSEFFSICFTCMYSSVVYRAKFPSIYVLGCER